MIAIVDYGLGNVQAFANIYKRLNIPTTLASTAESLSQADRIILPGVGSFDWAMQCVFKWLNRRGGKRRSYNWPQFRRLLERQKVARPRITEVSRRRVFA